MILSVNISYSSDENTLGVPSDPICHPQHGNPIAKISHRKVLSFQLAVPQEASPRNRIDSNENSPRLHHARNKSVYSSGAINDSRFGTRHTRNASMVSFNEGSDLQFQEATNTPSFLGKHIQHAWAANTNVKSLEAFEQDKNIDPQVLHDRELAANKGLSVLPQFPDPLVAFSAVTRPQLQVEKADFVSGIVPGDLAVGSEDKPRRHRRFYSALAGSNFSDYQASRCVSLSSVMSLGTNKETMEAWSKNANANPRDVQDLERRESIGLPVLPVFPEPPIKILVKKSALPVIKPAEKVKTNWLCCLGRRSNKVAQG